MKVRKNLFLFCLFMGLAVTGGFFGCRSALETTQTNGPKPVTDRADPDGPYGLADALKEKHEEYLAKAIEQYRKALTRPETADQASYQLGLLLSERGDFEKAVGYLERLGSERRDSFAVSKALGLCYLRLGNYAQALPPLERASILNPRDGEVLYTIGLIYEAENFAEEAEEYFRRTVDLSPGTQWSERAGAHLESLQTRSVDYEGAEILEGEVRDLILDAPGQEDYPDAAAVILLDQERLTISPDRTQTREIHRVIKILNDRAYYRSEVKISYDSLEETVRVDLARTITPDGRVIKVGKKAMRDLTPWSGFPMYSNAKVTVISMPEIEDGSIIEIKATIFSSKLDYGQYFGDYFGFQDWEPTKVSRFILEVPEDVPFRTRFLHTDPIKPRIEYLPGKNPSGAKQGSSEGLRYTWERRDVPAIKWETYMPGWVDVAPIILVSSMPDWEAFGEWWWNLARDRIKVDRSIREKIARLTDETMTAEEKARMIYHYVASKIRYVGLEYGEGGFRPRDATDVFANKYGDCKDKAILLVAMLRDVGLSAHPALVGTRGGLWDLEPAVPMSQFDHCIAVVEIDGKKVWLDPTDETCPYGELPGVDQGRQALVFFDDGAKFFTTPVFPPEKNLARWEVQADVGTDGTMRARARAAFTGIRGDWKRSEYKSYSPEERRDLVKEMVSKLFPGATLESCTFSPLDDLATHVAIDLEFTVPDYAERAGGLLFFRVPDLYPTGEPVGKEERAHPLVWDTTEMVEKRIAVEIPPGYRIRFLPEDYEIHLPYASYSQVYRIEGREIELRVLEKRSTRSISTAQYPSFRAYEERIRRESKRFVILEKADSSDGST